MSVLGKAAAQYYSKYHPRLVTPKNKGLAGNSSYVRELANRLFSKPKRGLAKPITPAGSPERTNYIKNGINKFDDQLDSHFDIKF